MKSTKIILAGILMLSVPSWAQENAVPAATLAPLGLAPGDEINVRMFDLPDTGLAGVHVHVNPDGTVHVPYAGTIAVLGKSPTEVETAVAESLQARGIVKQPNVVVEVISAVNLNVNVLGEVRNPKQIPLYAPTPISYIIGQVGGVTGLAARHVTILHHSDQSPTSVDYDPDSLNAHALSTLVVPGDIVTVSSRGVFFVAGEVNRPGVFPMGGAISVGQANATSGIGVVKQMTLLQALAQAGGITAIAARSKMRIIRTVDGKREEIIVDQVKLYKGQVADPILHPDDIIYVPSSYIRAQTNNLFSTAISSLYAYGEYNNLTK